MTAARVRGNGLGCAKVFAAALGGKSIDLLDLLSQGYDCNVFEDNVPFVEVDDASVELVVDYVDEPTLAAEVRLHMLFKRWGDGRAPGVENGCISTEYRPVP